MEKVVYYNGGKKRGEGEMDYSSFSYGVVAGLVLGLLISFLSSLFQKLMERMRKNQ